MSEESKQSLGGKARAVKLSQEERTSIASSAAKARWAKESEAAMLRLRVEVNKFQNFIGQPIDC